MIPSKFVAGYVAASRTPREPGVFSELLSNLLAGFNARSMLDPNMDTSVTYHLIKTAQKASEMLRIGERYLILFDSGQLEFLARMNYVFLSKSDSMLKAVVASEVIERAAVLGRWDCVSALLPLRQEYMSGWRSNHQDYLTALKLAENQAAFLALHELAHIHVERETWQATEARSNVDVIRRNLRGIGEQLTRDADAAERAFQRLMSSTEVDAELKRMDTSSRNLGQEMLLGVLAAAKETRYLAEMFLRPSEDFTIELVCDLRASIDTALMFWSENEAEMWGSDDLTADDSQFATLPTAILIAITALTVQRFLLHISHEAHKLSPIANISQRLSASSTVRSAYARVCLGGMWLRAVHLGTGKVPENVRTGVGEFFERTGERVTGMLAGTSLSEFYDDAVDRLSNMKRGNVAADELVRNGFRDFGFELHL